MGECVNSSGTLSWKGFAGLGCVTLSTLLLEVLLTRIFSVTMWYHYAFMAVSLAMFGMTLGAVIVHLKPAWFDGENARPALAIGSVGFAAAIVLSFLTHLCIPFYVEVSLLGLYNLALTYCVVAIPFVIGGVVVTVALTRFPAQLSRLYAADLVGAALGCLLLIEFLEWTDGPTTVFAAAGIAALGGMLFADEAGRPRLRLAAATLAMLLLGFVAVNQRLLLSQESMVPLRYVKGEIEGPPIFEKWNSHSRVRVIGDERSPEPPFGWGFSPRLPPELKARQLIVNIDANAGTVMTGFDGDLKKVSHLGYDITNIAHTLRRKSSVLVIGAGGGRDLLSALFFGQSFITGVEVNRDIISMVTEAFGEFTGHPDRWPGVRLIHDEARSFLTRASESFDLIQVSLIDTWAATAAGAFVLSENTLYTVEAWELFLKRLKPAGILSFSRWYIADDPGEMYRLVTLACAALRRQGVTNPAAHILIARVPAPRHTGNPKDGVGTILVSRDPFSVSDLERWDEVCRTLAFEVVLSPKVSIDPMYGKILGEPDLLNLAAGFPVDISPPTDDRPFFFHLIRLRDLLKHPPGKAKVEVFLVALLVIVLVLTAVFILLPLGLVASSTRSGVVSDTGSGSGLGRFGLYFGGIGLGFILVEMGQLQWLTVLLGHPTYSLSVVLFSLLLACGIGSQTTQGVTGEPASALRKRLVLLLVLLAVAGLSTPFVVSAMAGQSTGWRVMAAIMLVGLPGIGMGMAFPLGMRIAAVACSRHTAWLWGINGAVSIVGSILAILIALEWGIAAVFWTGSACYLVALAAAMHFPGTPGGGGQSNPSTDNETIPEVNRS